jgi:hypothetical protein
MIFSTVPGMAVFGESRIRADLAIRGSAISFFTLARVASASFFCRFDRAWTDSGTEVKHLLPRSAQESP